MADRAAGLPPDATTAADEWARDHGCRSIEFCCQAPIAAFEAGWHAAGPVIAAEAARQERQRWLDALGGPPFDAAGYRNLADWLELPGMITGPWSMHLRKIADLLEGDAP